MSHRATLRRLRRRLPPDDDDGCLFCCRRLRHTVHEVVTDPDGEPERCPRCGRALVITLRIGDGR